MTAREIQQAECAYNQCLYNKAVKDLEAMQEGLAKFRDNRNCKENRADWKKYGSALTFKEYCEFMVTEFYPYHIEKQQAEVARLKKILEAQCDA